MRGMTFYAEYTDSARKLPTGNIVAVEREYSRWDKFAGSFVYEAVGALFSRPNSPVAGTSVAQSYIDSNCRKVTEDEARRVHPRLFEYLAEAEREAHATA